MNLIHSSWDIISVLENTGGYYMSVVGGRIPKSVRVWRRQAYADTE